MLFPFKKNSISKMILISPNLYLIDIDKRVAMILFNYLFFKYSKDFWFFLWQKVQRVKCQMFVLFNWLSLFKNQLVDVKYGYFNHFLSLNWQTADIISQVIVWLYLMYYFTVKELKTEDSTVFSFCQSMTDLSRSNPISLQSIGYIGWSYVLQRYKKSVFCLTRLS